MNILTITISCFVLFACVQKSYFKEIDVVYSIHHVKNIIAISYLNDWNNKGFSLCHVPTPMDLLTNAIAIFYIRGGIKPELFSADSTHMNPSGYHIWKKEIEKNLL